MINTYNLFYTPVVHTKVPISFDIHKKIITYVENNYKEEDILSIRNGLQVHGDFDGKEELNNNLDRFLKNTIHLKIFHSWLNVLGNNSYNRPHTHTGDTISHAGVYYLSAQNNNINFTKDGDVFELEPKLFDLLIFPVNLVHYVLPEKRNEKRISYAFNLTNVAEEGK